MKIFLDTNIIISAVTTRGLCADVFREVLRSHQLVISEDLILEVRRILQEKIRAPGELINDLIEVLQEDAIRSTRRCVYNIPVQDKGDLMILSSALSGKTELFITGGKELLELGKIKSLKIISPREFWKKLQKK